MAGRQSSKRESKFTKFLEITGRFCLCRGSTCSRSRSMDDSVDLMNRLGSALLSARVLYRSKGGFSAVSTDAALDSGLQCSIWTSRNGLEVPDCSRGGFAPRIV